MLPKVLDAEIKRRHIGVDDESGLVHSVVGTAANVADVTQVDRLLHGEENMVGATLIHAPSSTKNKDGKRDPEMHQTKMYGQPTSCNPV
jgi:IS5 family transposase